MCEGCTQRVGREYDVCPLIKEKEEYLGKDGLCTIEFVGAILRKHKAIDQYLEAEADLISFKKDRQ